MKRWIYIIVAALALVAIAAYFVFSVSARNEEDAYIYIDRDDTIDSVYAKVEEVAHPSSLLGFKALASLKKYGEHIRTGRYRVEPGMTMTQLFRDLRNHNEVPINLVVPARRELHDWVGRVAAQLMMDSVELSEAVATLPCVEAGGRKALPVEIIPNTYEVYWDMSAEKLVERMQTEYKRFWTDERLQKAKDKGLTQLEVSTLASIVDSESAYDPEKPRIAGLYLNRLHKGMLLQSDPTVIFAVGDFTIRRVLNEHLRTESPFNTYRVKGLPPGPIRIASVAGLDAVLNAEQNDYLYMCAKEDFSGSHNFATTYGEHLQNARRYINELNKRGIKK